MAVPAVRAPGGGWLYWDGNRVESHGNVDRELLAKLRGKNVPVEAEPEHTDEGIFDRDDTVTVPRIRSRSELFRAVETAGSTEFRWINP